jgi:hypothetical protein
LPRLASILAPSLLVPALAAVALAGCAGKGNRVPSSTATTARAAPGAGGSGSPTRAQALAFARAVNLTAADVPGLHAAAKSERSPADRRTERQLAHCAGLSGSSQLLEAGSADFEHAGGISHFDVSSNVSVSRSAALAAHELAQLSSPRTKGCLKHFLAALLNESLRSAIVGPVSVQTGTPPAAGTSGSVGLRISTSITVHAIPIPFYLDILGFVYRQAQVSLMSTGVVVPFPAATQQRLFLTLLARAKSHRP